MKITIVHLYYDLMNLYGESGNIKALKKQLEDQGIDVSIKFLTIDDELDFNNYDVVYMGMGTLENQKIVLKHLLKYKNDIKKYILDNKFFIATGNAYELFGKYIIDKKKIKTLGIFNYTSKIEDFRMVDECIFKTDLIKNYVIGFQNQGSVIKDNKNHLFEVIKGIGSYPKSEYEGYHEYNFYGTYLIGPLLIRNPELLKYIVKKIINSKDPDFKFKRFNLKLENNAYNEFVNLKYKDMDIFQNQ